VVVCGEFLAIRGFAPVFWLDSCGVWAPETRLFGAKTWTKRGCIVVVVVFSLVVFQFELWLVGRETI
jgi:hypothetical protein